MGRAAAKRLLLGVLLLCLTVAPVSQAGPYKTYIQKGNLRVGFWGHVAPRKLPRLGLAPVSVSISSEIETVDDSTPPQLQTIEVEINRNGHLNPQGLPVCRFRQVQPASTAKALSACRSAVVGEGTFNADVALPEQSPFPSSGRIVAFNGRSHGKPAILAHIYGTLPLPTSFTLPFQIERRQSGTYGLVLTAHLPQVAAEWGSIKGMSLTLGRRFRYRGRSRSYVSAGCPAPAGFPGTSFSLARAHFGFAGGEELRSIIVRACHVRG